MTSHFITDQNKNSEFNNIIFFDGVCFMCNRFVLFVLNYENRVKFNFTSLQSEFTQLFFEKEKYSTNTIYLWHNGKLYNKSSAILQIIKELRYPLRALYVFILIPRRIRDIIYDFISKNRYFIRKSSKCNLIHPRYSNRILN